MVPNQVVGSGRNGGRQGAPVPVLLSATSGRPGTHPAWPGLGVLGAPGTTWPGAFHDRLVLPPVVRITDYRRNRDMHFDPHTVPRWPTRLGVESKAASLPARRVEPIREPGVRLDHSLGLAAKVLLLLTAADGVSELIVPGGIDQELLQLPRHVGGPTGNHCRLALLGLGHYVPFDPTAGQEPGEKPPAFSI